MKFSTALVAPMLAQGSMAGGTAGLIYEACTCEISGYKFTLNSAKKGGCNYSDHIGSATIENYRGEVIEVNGERCHEIRMCISSGLGGSSTNGYQCDF
ncbi:hypothetical protein CMUS01_04330 [Colletotrichum musicola]|uniref:CVNH domain-containing protein n=1 Tax=Colletotrichum musicola TaxID=2175873 RepID=A0A8H6KXU7_9PEZI|nr:hypothetical protein CMUS01_04330 [Colletotrichum musicola]